MVSKLGLTADKIMPANQFQATSNGALYTTFTMIGTILSLPEMVTEIIYGHPEVQALIANDQYDLVMATLFLPMTSYPFVWRFQAPLVLSCPNALFPGIAPLLGGEDRPEYLILRPVSTGGVSFTDRLVNTILTHLLDYVFNTMPKSSVMTAARRHMPDIPSFEHIEKNISLVLTNSHAIFNGPRVLPPQIIEVGGMQCRPAEPLPAVKKNTPFNSHEVYLSQCF